MDNLITMYGSELALIIRLVTLVIILILLIPLQIREAKVRNGLRKLRILLLLLGLILFTTNLLTIYFLVDAIINGTTTKLINSILQVINATAFLGISIIIYLIYHQQYSPEAKEIHKQVDIEEKRVKDLTKS